MLKIVLVTFNCDSSAIFPLTPFCPPALDGTKNRLPFCVGGGGDRSLWAGTTRSPWTPAHLHAPGHRRTPAPLTASPKHPSLPAVHHALCVHSRLNDCPTDGRRTNMQIPSQTKKKKVSAAGP